MDESRGKRIVTISFIMGFLAAFLFMAVAALIYLRYGDLPVATADKPFPYEKTIVQIPLNARIDRQLATVPLSPTSDNLVLGAHVYVAHCAVCHGRPGQNSSFAQWEYPIAPQLWTKHQTASSASVTILRMFRIGRLRTAFAYGHAILPAYPHRIPDVASELTHSTGR